MKPLLAVFLPLLIAYATALQWCIDRWNASTQYFEHCWLVPPIAAVVVWLRRAQWTTQSAVVDWRGFWLLGPALLLHLYGALLMIDSASALSLVLAVPGAAWLALGTARLRGLWPALWLACFAVPAPIYVEGRLAFVLKEFAVQAGAGLANVFGAAVVRSGSHLQLTGLNETLFVADACSGLRSLMAMVTLGYCLAFFVGQPTWRRRLGLLAATVPIAIGANVVRIAMLCLLARWFGVPFTEGTGHTIANVVEWIADVGCLLLLDALLARRMRATIVAPAPVPVATVLPNRGSLGRCAWALWLVAAPLLWLSLYRPAGGDRQRAVRLPAEVASWRLIDRTEQEERTFQKALPRWIELLGTPDFVWRRYRDDGNRRIHLVALFHDTNWKSVHAPRICIEGSNMEIEEDDVVPAPWLGDGLSVSRIIAKSRSDGWRYVTLSVFGTRTWSSGSYAEFSWHHMPLALLRRNESGFLLRVEAPILRDEAVAIAEQRCAGFLAALVPAAREQLR